MMWHHTVPLNRLIQGLGRAQQWVWFLQSYSHQTAHAPFHKIIVLATVLSISLWELTVVKTWIFRLQAMP